MHSRVKNFFLELMFSAALEKKKKRKQQKNSSCFAINPRLSVSSEASTLRALGARG